MNDMAWPCAGANSLPDAAMGVSELVRTSHGDLPQLLYL